MDGDAAGLSADPALVATWVRGWARARETPAPEPYGDGHRVEVGWPEQIRRYVFPGVSEEIARLGADLRTPWIYLKACASPDALRACLPPRWTVAPARFLMTRRLVDAPPRRLPDGYRLRIDDGPAGPIATVARADAIAASGRVVLVDEVAIFDRIATEPAHQRRGLGSAVMAGLSQAVAVQGARRAVLVATADGRQLYETLGWRLHALYASAVIPGPPG